MERCEEALLECILDCNNDMECLSTCIRLETKCTDSESDISVTNVFHRPLSMNLNCDPFYSGCPCEFGCLEGCTDCPNPVCYCEVNNCKL